MSIYIGYLKQGFDVLRGRFRRIDVVFHRTHFQLLPDLTQFQVGEEKQMNKTTKFVFFSIPLVFLWKSLGLDF